MGTVGMQAHRCLKDLACIGQCNYSHNLVGNPLLCDRLAPMRFCPGHKELIVSLKAASPVQVGMQSLDWTKLV